MKYFGRRILEEQKDACRLSLSHSLSLSLSLFLSLSSLITQMKNTQTIRSTTSCTLVKSD